MTLDSLLNLCTDVCVVLSVRDKQADIDANSPSRCIRGTKANSLCVEVFHPVIAGYRIQLAAPLHQLSVILRSPRAI